MYLLFIFYTIVFCALLLWIAHTILKSNYLLYSTNVPSAGRLIWLLTLFCILSIYSYTSVSVAAQSLSFPGVSGYFLLKMFLIVFVVSIITLLIAYYTSYLISVYIFKTSELIRDLEEDKTYNVIFRTMSFLLVSLAFIPVSTYYMYLFTPDAGVTLYQ